MRAKELTIQTKRKEEYLGARVPKELKEKVIKLAAGLEIPVSYLIRKILGREFGESALGRNFDRSITAAETTRGNPEKVSAHEFPKVLGWERIRLNRGTTCSACAANIDPGTYATLGLPVQGEEYIILCDVCSESL